MLKIAARAKINLYLDIVGVRPDGFHNIRSIMQSVSLADELDFAISEHPTSVWYGGPTASDFHDDIVTRACKLVDEAAERSSNSLIKVLKRIPVAAGLAGGSADAAATLVGLNKLHALGFGQVALRVLARRLGADVPFCLEGGIRLAEDTGRHLSRVREMPDCLVVVATPDLAISTAEAYAEFDQAGAPREGADAAFERLSGALSAADFDGVCAGLFNAFEAVVVPAHPEVARLKEAAVESGAAAALMSGSGPSVFSLTRFRNTAEAIVAAQRRLTDNVFLVSACQTGLEVVE